MDGTEVKMKTGQRNIFKGFAANEAGNVAMIAALTIIPIVTIAGFAIDFQVTTTQKARVQQAIDSAVLIRILDAVVVAARVAVDEARIGHRGPGVGIGHKDAY